MEIRELELFLVVAELLHFGRASQACHLSPSALTRTIQRLEDELGQPLFIRDNRSVQMTAAGEKFVLYARNTVQSYHDFQRSLSGRQQLSGSLSLYASITAVYSILPDLVEVYRKAYADVQLELRTGAAEKAVAQVETGEIDIAVAALPDRRGSGIAFLPLMTTELVFIATRKMAQEKIVDPDNFLDLSRVPLVVPHSGLSRRRLDQRLKKRVSSPISVQKSLATRRLYRWFISAAVLELFLSWSWNAVPFGMKLSSWQTPRSWILTLSVCARVERIFKNQWLWHSGHWLKISCGKNDCQPVYWPAITVLRQSPWMGFAMLMTRQSDFSIDEITGSLFFASGPGLHQAVCQQSVIAVGFKTVCPES